MKSEDTKQFSKIDESLTNSEKQFLIDATAGFLATAMKGCWIDTKKEGSKPIFSKNFEPLSNCFWGSSDCMYLRILHFYDEPCSITRDAGFRETLQEDLKKDDMDFDKINNYLSDFCVFANSVGKPLQKRYSAIRSKDRFLKKLSIEYNSNYFGYLAKSEDCGFSEKEKEYIGIIRDGMKVAEDKLLDVYKSFEEQYCETTM